MDLRERVPEPKLEHAKAGGVRLGRNPCGGGRENERSELCSFITEIITPLNKIALYMFSYVLSVFFMQ